MAFCRTLMSGGTRIRTGDTMIFSHVLYQLSYPARRGETPEQILRYEVVAIKRPTYLPGEAMISAVALRRSSAPLRL